MSVHVSTYQLDAVAAVVGCSVGCVYVRVVVGESVTIYRHDLGVRGLDKHANDL